MSNDSPFGSKTRQAIVEDYFRAHPDPAPTSEAWKHVYRLLLWIDQGTGLAHVYDANHMQKGGNFYERAVRFTDALCAKLAVPKNKLGDHIDVLFKGCVAEYRRRKAKRAELPPEADEEAAAEAELESELLAEVRALLKKHGLAPDRIDLAAFEIESHAKEFFTAGNQRKNALGEGFEDIVAHLLVDSAKLPVATVRTRSRLFDLPGFRKAAPVAALGGKPERLPKPDIAVVDDQYTYAIVTAKWSMRQDRERQFANEYNAYVKNLQQRAEVRFFLITNEFDLARLDNVARAQPDGAGYLFHTIFHVNLELLRATHGPDLDRHAVGGWITAGKLASLDTFLAMMGATYGAAPVSPTAERDPRGAIPRARRRRTR
jgi:hypothetical protein